MKDEKQLTLQDLADAKEVIAKFNAMLMPSSNIVDVKYAVGEMLKVARDGKLRDETGHYGTDAVLQDLKRKAAEFGVELAENLED